MSRLEASKWIEMAYTQVHSHKVSTEFNTHHRHILPPFRNCHLLNARHSRATHSTPLMRRRVLPMLERNIPGVWGHKLIWGHKLDSTCSSST